MSSDKMSSDKPLNKEKKYIINNQKLMDEWDYETNKELGLNPETVSEGSNIRPWWKCKNGHKWQAQVGHRVNGTGCPYCSGHLVIQGETDLETINPSLALEWHPTKNGILTPKDVKPHSNKKVWWICKLGHEYESRIYSRTDGQGCPYCAGKKILEGYNDLQTTNQKLALEWNYEKNKPLLPSMITRGSHKKVWWKCNHGHEWEATVHNRSKGRGCPECARINRINKYNIDIEI